jgi:hypothetical protein
MAAFATVGETFTRVLPKTHSIPTIGKVCCAALSTQRENGDEETGEAKVAAGVTWNLLPGIARRSYTPLQVVSAFAVAVCWPCICPV